MPRNKVQTQKGLSLNEFLKHYGTEQLCYEALFNWRWQDGFSCPKCGHDQCCELKTNKLRQCYRCNHQTSVTAGTIFESTKLPLTIWFQGMYLMTQAKKGISSMQLHRQLGISYNAAWRLKHKLMQVMMERDDNQPLSGFVQIDDAYLGGERTGGKRGRGAANKNPFVAAVQTTNDGNPVRIKLTILKGFLASELLSWGQQHLQQDTVVTSDGLACFNELTKAGCKHERIVCGKGRHASVERPEFYWVNTVLGNLKSSLRSTYHAIRPKYAQRYLAECQYIFNRRFDLCQLIPRLSFVALKTPPMPERLLKIRLR
ncbi:MAG: IS1595 family transposase [Gammaproteobacteria bacterium]|nr:IS1595 family transposase [Gammaproteobacteria bacterium]